MVWKVLAAIVLIWVAFAMIGWALDALFPLLALAAVGVGLYYLLRSINSNKSSSKIDF
ncbi:hypothetical protein [Millisia brevis]|uniref:hypothetical protein n=1 Tax=Millisia brevis TaxID=264148 RepID=UPI0012ED9619|nr:hypothetical protein [Millisia brevis]